MSSIRRAPCDSCPYRRDVPSGVWASEEYEKLRLYDADTAYQPTAAFHCHTTAAEYCHGWALVHGPYDLLALRVAGCRGQWDCKVPENVTPLFTSGAEAAEHGQREIRRPKDRARRTARKIVLRRQENL